MQADARLAPPHSLHRLLRRWSGQSSPPLTPCIGYTARLLLRGASRCIGLSAPPRAQLLSPSAASSAAAGAISSRRFVVHKANGSLPLVRSDREDSGTPQESLEQVLATLWIRRRLPWFVCVPRTRCDRYAPPVKIAGGCVSLAAGVCVDDKTQSAWCSCRGSRLLYLYTK